MEGEPHRVFSYSSGAAGTGFNTTAGCSIQNETLGHAWGKDERTCDEQLTDDILQSIPHCSPFKGTSSRKRLLKAAELPANRL